MKLQFEIVRKFPLVEEEVDIAHAYTLGQVSVEFSTENCFTDYRNKIVNMTKKTQAHTKSEIKKYLIDMFTEIYGVDVKILEIK